MQNLETLKELAAALPKAFAGNAIDLVTKMGEVVEGIGDKPIEWRPPTLKVVQATTDRSKLPKGVNIGSMVLGEDILGQPQRIIPIRIWDSRQKWAADRDSATLECSSPDAVVGYIGKRCKECEFSKFDTETNRSACNKSKTVLAITEDLKEVMVINFSKTNYANGVAWHQLMRKVGVAPYRRVYEMAAKANAKYKNVEALTVENAEKDSVTNKDAIPFLEELFKRVSEDREEYLKVFHEMVMNRQQNSALLSAPADDDGHPALPAEVAPATEAQTSAANKYKL